MIKEYFEEVLENYEKFSKEKDFPGPIPNIIKVKIPTAIQNLANLNSSYFYEGSIGKGNISEVPWIRVYEKEISPSAREEYYIVYLFNAKMNGFYLSLNQGVTQYNELYGLSAKENMKIITDKIKSKLAQKNFPLEKINLNAKNELGNEYEMCHICGKFYSSRNVPADSVLIQDLKAIVKVYEDLKELIGNSVLNLDLNYTPEKIKKIRSINRKKTKSEIEDIILLKHKIKLYEEDLDEESSEEDYERWKSAMERI